MSHGHIKHEQRIELAALWRAGMKQKEIAKMLNVHASSVSRELKRNSTQSGEYWVNKSQQKCDERRTKANQQFRKIEGNEKLRNHIIRKLKKYWSRNKSQGD